MPEAPSRSISKKKYKKYKRNIMTLVLYIINKQNVWKDARQITNELRDELIQMSIEIPFGVRAVQFYLKRLFIAGLIFRDIRTKRLNHCIRYVAFYAPVLAGRRERRVVIGKCSMLE